MRLVPIERHPLRRVGVEALEVVLLQRPVVPGAHRDVIEPAAPRTVALVAVVDVREDRRVEIAGLLEQARRLDI